MAVDLEVELRQIDMPNLGIRGRVRSNLLIDAVDTSSNWKWQSDFFCVANCYSY